MTWATSYIKELIEGRAVKFRPRGGSMKGKVESGQLVTVAPLDDVPLKIGDIVLCKVKGSQYLHLVKDISKGRYLIGNNLGKINGWTHLHAIYGKCVAIED